MACRGDRGGATGGGGCAAAASEAAIGAGVEEVPRMGLKGNHAVGYFCVVASDYYFFFNYYFFYLSFSKFDLVVKASRRDEFEGRETACLLLRLLFSAFQNYMCSEEFALR